jgi:hypothetical protein
MTITTEAHTTLRLQALVIEKFHVVELILANHEEASVAVIGPHKRIRTKINIYISATPEESLVAL